MMYKIVISVVILLSTCTGAYSQHNFDSVKICHTKGELRSIAIGEYEVRMAGGQFLSLTSEDGAITYEANGRLFIIRNLIKGSFLKVQLSDKGVILNTKDTSFVLSSPESISLNSTDSINAEEALFSIGDFSFMIEFKKGRLSKVSLPTTNKYVVIGLVQVQGKHTWDFSVESSEHRNKVLLTYVFNRPYLLSIHDDKNKVGIRLLAKKKDGFFVELVGQEIYENNAFASDNSYKLQYAKDGQLKSRNSKFKLICEE